MSDFKDSSRAVRGHHHWNGGSIGGSATINPMARGGAVLDKVDTNPGHPEVYSKEGDRMNGNTLTQRKEAPTQELTEHGGRTPLTAGFKKGGPAKHFHVHKHFHAKGGRTHSVSHSYSAAEKHAETFAGGGSVHDSTNVPPGSPDYRRGGRTKPVRKNAGGATYAPGGAVAPPVMGGAPPGAGAALPTLRAAPPMGGRVAARPPGLPVRSGAPLRRPMAMPGPQALMRARGGPIPARKAAKQEVAKHERKAPPRGHGAR